MDKQTIEARLREHLSEALTSNDISDWFVIASNGSMNYGLETENSDIDSKLLTIPSLKQLINDKRSNCLHEMSDNGEHVEIKDIAIYMKTILKQNINFVETLFAKGIIVNPKYKDEWNALVKNREKIARYDTHRAVKCMYGMMIQKQKDMVTPTPGRMKSIEKIGYDAKSFHHVIRLGMFLSDYVRGMKYADCLTLHDELEYGLLTNSKLGEYTLDEADMLCDELFDLFGSDADLFLSRDVSDEEIHNRLEVKNLIDEIVYNVVEKSIKGYK